MSNAPVVNGGILASEQLRQAKNTLVVLATLVSRAAIQGGMEADEAFSLSDAFIQRSERFNNLQQITNLQYNMVLDFADRMSSIRQGEKAYPADHIHFKLRPPSLFGKDMRLGYSQGAFYEPSVSFS